MNLVSSLNRLSFGLSLNRPFTRSLSCSPALFFKQSQCLFAEPLKKKKRMDPAIIKAREDRKKKKIEKQIRRLEKNSRQLKPIDECEIPIEISDNKKLYQRTSINIPDDIQEKRILVEKKWAKYIRDEHLTNTQMLDRIAYSQQRALDELRMESEELYHEAAQVDLHLLPIKIDGPNNTPPIMEYVAPDGDYLNISKKW